MLKHSLLIAFRIVRKYTQFFLINLVGLSAGLASALFIFLWVTDELSVDKLNEKDDRIYQVLQNIDAGDEIITLDPTPGPLAAGLAREMPEVEKGVAIVLPRKLFSGVLVFDETIVKITPQFVDTSFFDIFTLPFKQGSQNQLFKSKNSICLSEKTAHDLFHTTDNVIGKLVEFRNAEFAGVYEVVGVFDNLPSNVTHQFQVLLNFDRYLEVRQGEAQWGNGGPATVVLLKPGTDVDGFNVKIKDYLKTKVDDSSSTLYAQKLSDRYLFNRFENGLPVGGRIFYVRLFSLVAIFVLAIACVNYMNLATARIASRLKQIGVKKAIGASRLSLIVECITESVFTSLLALIISLGIIVVLLPDFNTLTGKQIGFPQPLLIGGALIITIITGVVSGAYPAFYASRFEPIRVLKGTSTRFRVDEWTRRSLVGFQFVISVVLVFSVAVIYSQFQLIQEKDLGYERERVISFERIGRLGEDLDAFLSQIKSVPGVTEAAFMYGDLPGKLGSGGGHRWEGQKPDEQGTQFYYMNGSYGLIELFGLELIEGRSFSREFKTDEDNAIIFNETAIKLMGLKDPIGKTVNFYGDRQIIGVVKDFNFVSLHEGKEKPLFLYVVTKWTGGKIVVKLEKGREKETLAGIDGVFHQFNPGFPFDYKFLDDDFNAMYASESRVTTLVQYFTIIAIVISCLGLFGLTAFTIQRRYKELSLRKLLGSTNLRTIGLLSREFMSIVLISTTIGLAVGYYISTKWLDSFAYRVNIGISYFAITVIVTVMIAWMAIALQATKATRISIAESLRKVD